MRIRMRSIGSSISQKVLFYQGFSPVSYTHLDVYKRQSLPSMYAVPFQKQPRVRIIVRRIGEPQLRDPLFLSLIHI